MWFSRKAEPVAQAPTYSALSTQHSALLFDPAFRRRLERLAIRTRQTLAWRAVGEHRSPRQSPSREFTDFRQYSQGEDLRYLDWNTYARLGELVTRLGEVSTELTVHLLVDTSASMNWGDPNKSWYARRLAAALGYLSLWHFDRLVIAPFDSGLGAAFGPSRGRAAIGPMFTYLERLPARGASDFARPLAEYARRQRSRGLLLLVSDLLTTEEGDPIAALQPFLERRWDVAVFHVLDPQEVEPSYVGDLRLLDVEQDGGRGLRVMPDDETLANYRAAFDHWLGGIEQSCAAKRLSYLRVLTSWPFETLVLQFLLEGGLIGPRGDRRATSRTAVRA
ncbi:MAG: DUF58 domain-containing protein [Chloroflexia bacterium]